jgi:uncharacterized membrane protein
LCAIAYTILVMRIKAVHGAGSDIDRAIGSDVKGKISLVCYVAAMVSSLFMPIVGLLFTVAVALMWLIPDRRIERVLADRTK